MANDSAAKLDSGFKCMECGHKFRTVKAAEKAAFGEHGCPKCGSSDIDLGGVPAVKKW
jgi:DNA-directed RNA polymerase subunit RPC12/RpoP